MFQESWLSLIFPSLSHFDNFISTAPSSFWVIKSKSPYTSWHMSWRGVDSDILLDLSEFFFYIFFFYMLLSHKVLICFFAVILLSGESGF